ncbi:MAG TPA: tetratricopeptide repeat protein [Planctomycetota bacterium]|nr:tetratricopeptide repeat protein [Planctomycetota bacterium]HPY73955.1 tetratricopeptide repeat protein [Planctomycetota bacterium]HQA99578.1 tetratricopeptide repeat protein [Planctomycetota bacterium]
METIKINNKKYTILQTIKKNAVWKIQDASAVPYFLKKIPTSYENFLKVFEILQKIQHEHIDHILFHAAEGNSTFVITTWAEEDILQNATNKSTLEKIKLALQFSLALRKIQSYFTQDKQSFFHGNLHPENIRLYEHKNKNIAKITDLGFARNIQHDYRAPEQILRQQETYKTDLYSYAKIMQQYLPELPEIQSLIQPMLHENPNKRPNNLPKLIRQLWTEQQILQNNKQAERCFILGSNLLQNEQYSYALKDFEQAIQLNPQYEDAYISLAECLQNLQKYEDALKIYDKALALNSHNPRTYENRAELYCQQGNTALAIQDLEHALELDSELPSVYGTLGQIYFNENNYNKALSYFSQVISLAPDFAQAYIDRAQVYEKQNNIENALQDYKTALQYELDTEQEKQIKKQIAFLKTQERQN